MATQNQNGRGRHPMHGHDDEYGQGQSGYGAGRFGDDRTMMEGRNRNQAMPRGRDERHDQGFGLDERFSGGRGGEEYWMDRGDRPYPQWDRRDRDIDRMQRERMNQDRGARSWNPQDSYGRGAPMERGPHRGKGPMNYQRSDERIRELVCEALTEDHNVDASNIEVTVKNGEVTLTGTVENRMQKRMAEDVVEQCSGVYDVHNQLRVGADVSRGKSGDKPRA